MRPAAGRRLPGAPVVPPQLVRRERARREALLEAAKSRAAGGGGGAVLPSRLVVACSCNEQAARSLRDSGHTRLEGLRPFPYAQLKCCLSKKTSFLLFAL